MFVFTVIMQCLVPALLLGVAHCYSSTFLRGDSGEQDRCGRKVSLVLLGLVQALHAAGPLLVAAYGSHLSSHAISAWTWWLLSWHTAPFVITGGVALSLCFSPPVTLTWPWQCVGAGVMGFGLLGLISASYCLKLW